MAEFQPTPRTQVKRLPKRGNYDRETVYQIRTGIRVPCRLFRGRAAVCDPDQLWPERGYAVSAWQRGEPHVEDAERGRTRVRDRDPCRRAGSGALGIHHSVNYRSVVILGTARLVEDPAEKMEALRIFTDHVMKGRWDDVRQPTEQELKATTVLALPLEEVSAKVRTGGPVDDEADYTLPVWAGVLPLETAVKAPVPDAQRKNDPPVPEYLKNYSR